MLGRDQLLDINICVEPCDGQGIVPSLSLRVPLIWFPGMMLDSCQAHALKAPPTQGFVVSYTGGSDGCVQSETGTARGLQVGI